MEIQKVEVCPWCGDKVIWNVTYDHWISAGMSFCDRAKYKFTKGFAVV